METHQSPTQRSISELCRRSSSKRKQELNPSHSDQQAAKKMRCINPDTPRPSIEIASGSQDIIFKEDNLDCELRSTPIFIHEGVFVGFWSADASGNGRRPVYCLVEVDFEFAYLKGNTFVLVRYDDFDPLDEFGDWLGDDTEDEEAMSPEEVKVWVEMMWESRIYAGLQDMTFED
jgi:hypothetical protein